MQIWAADQSMRGKLVLFSCKAFDFAARIVNPSTSSKSELEASSHILPVGIVLEDLVFWLTKFI